MFPEYILAAGKDTVMYFKLHKFFVTGNMR